LDVWNLAADLGLAVTEHRGEHRSGYWPDERIIRLRPGMSIRTTRSVLAHEIAHHVLEHRPTQFGPIRKRQELAANEWAATQLIRPDAYRECEHLREGHLGAMAHDLDVAPELIMVYRSMLQRLGDSVYLQPKMGAGMYAHREDVA
jgi:hypothetical protein